MQPSRKIPLLVLLVVISLSALTASAASASPGWKFNGTQLVGTESLLGAAHAPKLTIPGATVRCGYDLLYMSISNTVALGDGEVTNLPQYGCSARGSSCRVESIEAEKLPWSVHTTAIAGKNYVVIEGVRIGIEFSGELCALAGTRVIVKGNAGGIFDNTTSTLTFNSASFTATGTSLKVGSTAIEWTAEFPLEALGAHSGESLEVG